ncbi:MAG: hypothetical protein ACP5PW_01205 [Candidatus Dormibacteria bacterium]
MPTDTPAVPGGCSGRSRALCGGRETMQLQAFPRRARALAPT